MTPESYVAMVDVTLRPLADTHAARSMRTYLLDQFEFLGIRAPLRRQAMQAGTRYRWASPAELLDVAQRLWDKPEREFRYTAIDLLGRHARLLKMAHIPEILRLLQRDAWWETVDGLTAVIGQVMHAEFRSGVDVRSACDEWIKHPDYWVRRCAMLHQRGWRMDTDSERLFHYTEILSEEKEFFIRKAIGWALRDYARWNPECVRDFIEQNGARFSGLTVREATRHLAVRATFFANRLSTTRTDVSTHADLTW